jgi:hypothetical protein
MANTAYTQDEINEKFDLILRDIQENGLSLRKALGGYGMPSSKTFYEWLDNDEGKIKRYARACEARADVIFDEIVELADKQDADVVGEDQFGNPIVNHNIIQRNRLQVDTRKWMLAKMNPKKYGDKVEHSGDIALTGFSLKEVVNFDNAKQ